MISKKYIDLTRDEVLNVIDYILTDAEDKWRPTIKIVKRNDGLYDIETD